MKVPPIAVAPFDATQARQHQDAWANHLGVPVEFTNSIGRKFRLMSLKDVRRVNGQHIIQGSNDPASATLISVVTC